MEKDLDELLHQIYYNPENPGAFASIHKLYKQARLHSASVKYSDVQKWLSGELAYTLHKPARVNFERNPILVCGYDEQWQGDLADMQEFASQNDGYKYILTVIDIFSKFAWAVPLKNKSAPVVLNAFKRIFQNRFPSKLQTDQGKEFDNQILRKFLGENHIQYFTSKNPKTKCAVIERFNRTIKGRMFKYFTANGTRRYIDVLGELVTAYNHSFHRTIKMRPIDVTRDNENQVFVNTYGFKDKREFLLNRFKHSKLKIGDIVRTRYQLGPFDKSYYPLWTDNTYKITRKTKESRKPYHKIQDEQERELPRRYYPEEVQKIKPNFHRVEKILKKRTKNGKRQYFVKWLNHPSTLNSWVDASNLKSL